MGGLGWTFGGHWGSLRDHGEIHWRLPQQTTHWGQGELDMNPHKHTLGETVWAPWGGTARDPTAVREPDGVCTTLTHTGGWNVGFLLKCTCSATVAAIIGEGSLLSSAQVVAVPPIQSLLPLSNLPFPLVPVYPVNGGPTS